MGPTVHFLDHALGHAARGWPVFPLEPGAKRPHGRLVAHGLKDATTDLDVIHNWWKTEPRANIGLPTGVTFDALDIDGPHALSAISRAMPQSDSPDADPIIVGPTVRTPRGWHVYVVPTGRGNSVNIGGLAGVDWRGAGGYVVAPGSVKSDGSAWTVYLPDDPLYRPDADIRPAPAWLLKLLEPAVKPPASSGGPPEVPAADLYGRRALEGELGRLASAAPGERNHTLVRAAFRLRQLINDRKLDQRLVVSRLVQVGRQIGLGDEEIERTIESGFRGADQKSPGRRVA